MLPIADLNVVVDQLDHLDKVDHAVNWLSGDEFLFLVLGLPAIVLFFSTPILIVLAMLRQRTVRQRLINEVVLKLADKGQPIPPELFRQAVRERSDLRRSVLWMAVGAGIVLYGACSWDTDVIGIGFIPLMIGLGFFVAARLEQQQKDADRA